MPDQTILRSKESGAGLVGAVRSEDSMAVRCTDEAQWGSAVAKRIIAAATSLSPSMWTTIPLFVNNLTYSHGLQHVVKELAASGKLLTDLLCRTPLWDDSC
jgi:hypothetical protein